LRKKKQLTEQVYYQLPDLSMPSPQRLSVLPGTGGEPLARDAKSAAPAASNPITCGEFQVSSESFPRSTPTSGKWWCRLTHKFAKTGRYASEEENGEDMELHQL
jgi:hypothetical protein